MYPPVKHQTVFVHPNRPNTLTNVCIILFAFVGGMAVVGLYFSPQAQAKIHNLFQDGTAAVQSLVGSDFLEFGQEEFNEDALIAQPGFENQPFAPGDQEFDSGFATRNVQPSPRTFVLIRQSRTGSSCRPIRTCSGY